MNNIVEFEVTASPETALKKLAKADIAVYKLKKHGSKLHFGVSQEYVEKVFAIFSHSCYNTVIRKKSAKMRLISFMKVRFGLVAGAVIFAAAAFLSGNTVLRIKVIGNGAYLEEQVIAIAAECGAKEWSACRNLDAPLLQSRVMALSGVSFCSVQRDGAYLLIDVHTEEEHSSKLDFEPLKADIDGEVYRIVAICGTAERQAGDKVAAGDVLIGAYELSEEGEGNPCIAVGFAEISVKASVSLVFDKESEENTEAALKAATLYSERVLERSYKVSPCEGGVTYDVQFTYIKTVAINME
ncbi:MAG: sporulation protein YqfD [Clostridia bacterium]|nr:sporulation protein YqfD [Clostridia bacterium]